MIVSKKAVDKDEIVALALEDRFVISHKLVKA